MTRPLAAIAAFFMTLLYAILFIPSIANAAEPKLEEKTYLVWYLNPSVRLVLDKERPCVSTVPGKQWRRAAVQAIDGKHKKGCYIRGEGATKDMYIIVWSKTDRAEIPVDWFMEEKAMEPAFKGQF